MGGGDKADRHHEEMISEVLGLGVKMGLKTDPDFAIVGMIYSCSRSTLKIPVYFYKDEKELLIACIFQKESGSAERKFSDIRDDRKVLVDGGIPTIVVFTGRGFSSRYPGKMIAEGAIPLRDLRKYLIKYFNLDIKDPPALEKLEVLDIEWKDMPAKDRKAKCSVCNKRLTNDEYDRLPWIEYQGHAYVECRDCHPED